MTLPAQHLPPELALPQEPDLSEGWRITDLFGAEWACRKLAASRRRIKEVQQHAQAWRELINDWEAKELAGPRRDEAFFEGHLQEFARQQREATGAKTVKLPSGTISSRTVPARPLVTDERALIQFLQAYAREFERPVEDFLFVRIEPKKSALKEILVPAALREGLALISDGEPVPGLEVEPERVTFKVEVGE